MADRILDTSGLVCPIPILKASKALREMSAGTVLEVLATDPAAEKDFVAFCKATGNRLMDSGNRGGLYWFLIRRAS
jgi:tRNA 2-thiouridine synthesizing protein A